MEKQNSPTRSVERALNILECFLHKKEMILLEIADRPFLQYCSPDLMRAAGT